MALLVRAFAGLAFLLAIIAATLFGAARTWHYSQAWVFLAVFGLATTAITIDLARRDRALLARRVQAGPTAEHASLQRVIQSVAGVAFLALFMVSSLDWRAGWSHVPLAAVIAGDALVATGLLCVFFVFRANTFTSATIEIAHDQQVVSSGPYAIVRHPMYTGAVIMLLGAPPALGSWFGLAATLVLTMVIVWRLLDEERQLVRDLRGYAGYRARVRYRLVPRVW